MIDGALLREARVVAAAFVLRVLRLEGGTAARTAVGQECCACGDQNVEPVIFVSTGSGSAF